MSSYPGGKGQSGVYQWVINQVPPHTTKIELFLGLGAITQLMRPAVVNIGIDIDPLTIARFLAETGPGTTVINDDAISFLREYYRKLQTHAPQEHKGVFVYADPPYLAVDIDGRPIRTAKIYRHEFSTVEQHEQLLVELKKLPWMIAISGYPSKLYDGMLSDWRMISRRVRTRRSWAIECLWMNYPEPTRLHDY